MSIIIGIISGIGILIALLLIIALFVKKEYAIEREIVINQPLQKVFGYIKYLKNQDNYSVWNKLDPAMQKTYTGTDGTVGFMYAWDSTNKQAGKGTQEIRSVEEGKKIGMGLHFIRPFDGLANAYMSTTAMAADQTKVKWGIDSKMKYPMNIMLLFMNMDSMMGKDLEGGLGSLKKILENDAQH
ncbi:MAG: SRPBCC family protein [Chitinophagaceae bacterium]